MMIRFAITALVSGLCLSGGARAEPVEFAGWTLDFRNEATLVIAPGRDDAGSVEAELFGFDARSEIRAERVLDNGAEIGVRLGGRVQFDHPVRPGFSGRIGPGRDDPMGVLAPRGAFTGLTLGGPAEDAGLRARLETAFAYIDGGYGELVVGRDIGIARRFHEGPPSVFRRHRIASGGLDTSGIATLLTRNDLTGPAAKISYASPRIIGLRVGGSYTPRANLSGLDRDPDRAAAGVNEPRLENGLEAAINFTHRFREPGIRVETYGAFARAGLEIGPLRQDNGSVEVWSTGAKLGWDRFEVGADWLSSDNGGGRYKAWSIGAGMDIFNLDFSSEYGESQDDLIGADGAGWSLGVGRTFAEVFTLSAGVQRQSLDFTSGLTTKSTGPVIEMALRF